MKNLRLLLAIIGASITQLDSTRFVNSKVTGISVEGLDHVLQVLSLGRVVRRSAIGNISTQSEAKWTVSVEGHYHVS